ncbi:tubulin-specific chaperone A-like [Dendronephthya gigantea]|uniref:tubulin-specific chaperone A-like n=1 Tax=Dendronephthya gigantea TaxID=151771 RepID=UPI00106D25EE|nr:tubulin-specific chaperone A-like [Dendronephthya gigantea]
MASDPRLRQLKIKTNVVKRIGKEVKMYEKESQSLEEKVRQMESEGKDEYDIRKQKEVLAESKSMVPDTNRRLKTAIEDLKSYMGETEQELSESREFEEAKTLLQDVDS